MVRAASSLACRASLRHASAVVWAAGSAPQRAVGKNACGQDRRTVELTNVHPLPRSGDRHTGCTHGIHNKART